MSVESQTDLQGLQAAGEAVAVTLRKMREYARVGMSTLELDQYGAAILAAFGANPAPKKDYGFPGMACISINNEVCHGIPSSETILQEGDLVNIDVSAELNGFYADNGGSFVLGNDHRNLQPLVDASREILQLAVKKVRSRMKISDLGGYIEGEAKKRGYRVIKNICGHGVGRKLHEAPREIPCYRDRLNRERFRKNTVIALETFISTRARYVQEAPDGWTLRTDDGSFVAQHEHTLIVRDGEPIILTQANGI
ncbi:MAG: type I methionyl aminopeptidase [Saprospiraceae bacterium]|nr:type I methionyl aminopeptidase [Lewinella sp.]